jgi:hypothetical protein
MRLLNTFRAENNETKTKETKNDLHLEESHHQKIKQATIQFMIYQLGRQKSHFLQNLETRPHAIIFSTWRDRNCPISIS